MIIIAFIDLFSTLYVLFCIVLLFFFFYLLPETNFRLKQQLSHFTADREISKKNVFKYKMRHVSIGFLWRALPVPLAQCHPITSDHKWPLGKRQRKMCFIFSPVFCFIFIDSAEQVLPYFVVLSALHISFHDQLIPGPKRSLISA